MGDPRYKAIDRVLKRQQLKQDALIEVLTAALTGPEGALVRDGSGRRFRPWGGAEHRNRSGAFHAAESALQFGGALAMDLRQLFQRPPGPA